MATNEEMLVSAFQKQVAIRSSFSLGSNFWDQTFGIKQFQNGRLAVILNCVTFT